MSKNNPTRGLVEVLRSLMNDMLRVIGSTNCSHHNEVCRWLAQLQVISDAVAAQSKTPAAWYRPHIVTFDGVVRTDCPKDLQAELEGTVAWEVGTFSDGIRVTDKHGVTHHSQPLFPPLRFPVDADPATSPTGAKTDSERVSAASLQAALDHVENLCSFAYEHGYHELGYDPVKLIRQSIGDQPVAAGHALVNNDVAGYEVSDSSGHVIASCTDAGEVDRIVDERWEETLTVTPLVRVRSRSSTGKLPA